MLVSDDASDPSMSKVVVDAIGAFAGYRVAAPDLRGYNLSSKPQGRKAYALDVLTSDIDQVLA